MAESQEYSKYVITPEANRTSLSCDDVQVNESQSVSPNEKEDRSCATCGYRRISQVNYLDDTGNIVSVEQVVTCQSFLVQVRMLTASLPPTEIPNAINNLHQIPFSVVDTSLVCRGRWWYPASEVE
jgi:hypothetical protein